MIHPVNVIKDSTYSPYLLKQHGQRHTISCILMNPTSDAKPSDVLNDGLQSPLDLDYFFIGS